MQYAVAGSASQACHKQNGLQHEIAPVPRGGRCSAARRRAAVAAARAAARRRNAVAAAARAVVAGRRRRRHARVHGRRGHLLSHRSGQDAVPHAGLQLPRRRHDARAAARRPRRLRGPAVAARRRVLRQVDGLRRARVLEGRAAPPRRRARRRRAVGLRRGRRRVARRRAGGAREDRRAARRRRERGHPGDGAAALADGRALPWCWRDVLEGGAAVRGLL